jgi:hypothetical protein
VVACNNNSCLLILGDISLQEYTKFVYPFVTWTFGLIPSICLLQIKQLRTFVYSSLGGHMLFLYLGENL